MRSVMPSSRAISLLVWPLAMLSRMRRWRGVRPLLAALALAGNHGDAIDNLRATLGAPMPALVVTGDTAPERLRLLAAAGQPWLPKPLMPMRLRSWLQGLPASR